MGLFSWIFESSINEDDSAVNAPSTNCDGTPMVSDTHIDIEGKMFGQCSLEDISTDDMFSSTTTDMFDSPFDTGADDSFSSVDDSFTSLHDEW
jgi:hypothetical protein